jgi:hypothetical protein
MDKMRTCEFGWTSKCQPCEFKGKLYSHGSQLADGTRTLECDNGEWCERCSLI